jgi:hypothetical protein
MGQPIDFAGTNTVLVPAEGTEDRVCDMRVFSNGNCLVSCWKLSPAEVAGINATGRVFISMMTFGHRPPPVYVGDEASVRAVTEDFGGAWKAPADNGGAAP